MSVRPTRLLVAATLAAGMFIAVIYGVAWWLCDRPTLYHGHALSDWIAQANGRDTGQASVARELLRREIIPQLVTVMFQPLEEDSRLTAALAAYLDNTLPLISFRHTPKSLRGAGAAQDLGRIGPLAETAVPDLLRAIKAGNPQVRIAAAEALGDIHSAPETTLPALIECLADEVVEELPAAAAASLGKFGAAARAAVPGLKQLWHRDPGSRKEVESALSFISPGSVPVAAR